MLKLKENTYSINDDLYMLDAIVISATLLCSIQPSAMSTTRWTTDASNAFVDHAESYPATSAVGQGDGIAIDLRGLKGSWV